MKKKLNQIKRFRLLTSSKEGSFTSAVISARQENGKTQTSHLLNERIVYSFLGYRSRHEIGASIREIVRETTLHKQTVANALNNLPHLAYQHDGLWYPNEPPADWFCPRDFETAEHWSDQFAYVMLYIPRKQATANNRRFGLNHAVVFSYILSFTKRSNPTTRLSINYLSTLLNGLNRKTVSSVLNDLKAIGIIRYTQRGIRLEIEVLRLTDKHFDLFQRQPDRTISQTSTVTQSQPVTNKYEFKNDQFDEYRKICEPLMPQSYAERSIQIARFFNWDVDEFESNLKDQKRRSDENVGSGKCKIPNFGKFFVTPLEEQMQTIKKKRQVDEATERALAYQASPEGKMAEVEKEKAIAADPLHRYHMITPDSLLDRVRLSETSASNLVTAGNIIHNVLKHCRAFSYKKLGSSEKGKSIHEQIMRSALSKLNDHYKQEVLATREQFEAAIDEAISKVQPEMTPMFGVAQKVSDE